MSLLIGQKLVETAKIRKNSNATFWVIFKHCAVVECTFFEKSEHPIFSWNKCSKTETPYCIYSTYKNSQNTRISTWKMMRCRGKFLWILNWVKACSSQEFWEILSFTTRLFWPLQEDFSCAVLRLRNQCNPHFSLWIVILLSRNLAESHRCWKIELHLFWTPRIFDVRIDDLMCWDALKCFFLLF